jgi:hypothetical protein
VSSTKVHFTISDEALAIINRRAQSENKRGQWISEAVCDYDRILEGVGPAQEGGALESLNVRMAQLEKQIAALLVELKSRPTVTHE